MKNELKTFFRNLNSRIRSQQGNGRLGQPENIRKVVWAMLKKTSSTELNRLEDQGHGLEAGASVVHYTSIKVLISLLSGQSNKDDVADTGKFMRLSDSFHLNDPREGRHLLDRIGKAEELSELLTGCGSPHAYIASFVICSNGESCDVSREDSLAYWLAYGDRGRGCSIKFQPTRNDIGNFRKVVYGSEGADHIVEKLRSMWLRLLEVVDEIEHKCLKKEIQELLSKLIGEGLSKFLYLYKDDAYKDDQECRVVQPFKKDIEPQIHFDLKEPQEDLPFRPPRHYINHECLGVDKILSSGSIITIGPDAPHADSTKLYIERKLFDSGLSHVKVKTSKVPYVDSALRI